VQRVINEMTETVRRLGPLHLEPLHQFFAGMPEPEMSSDVLLAKGGR
jgi:hypothetical protein